MIISHSFPSFLSTFNQVTRSLDILKQNTPNTHFLLSIDSVIASKPCSLLFAKQGKTITNTLKNGFYFYQKGCVEWLDPSAIDWIEAIQQKNPLFSISTKGISSQVVKNMGVDLSLSDVPETISTRTLALPPFIYEKGHFHAVEEKAKSMVHILNSLYGQQGVMDQPRRVVYLDSNDEFVRMVTSLAKTFLPKTPVVGLHLEYIKAKQPKVIDSEVVNLQEEIFDSYHVVLSDEEVKKAIFLEDKIFIPKS